MKAETFIFEEVKKKSCQGKLFVTAHWFMAVLGESSFVFANDHQRVLVFLSGWYTVLLLKKQKNKHTCK